MTNYQPTPILGSYIVKLRDGLPLDQAVFHNILKDKLESITGTSVNVQASSASGLLGIDVETRAFADRPHIGTIAINDPLLGRFNEIHTELTRWMSQPSCPIEILAQDRARQVRLFPDLPSDRYSVSDTPALPVERHVHDVGADRNPYTGDGVLVGMIDSGFCNHRDLPLVGRDGGRVEVISCVENDNCRVERPDGFYNHLDEHGAAVAGLIAARSSTPLGKRFSIACDARIIVACIVIRSASSDWLSTRDSGVLGALYLLSARKCQVIVSALEWGPAFDGNGNSIYDGQEYLNLYQDAYQTLTERGSIWLSAAGNGSTRCSLSYPAAYHGVIPVMAIDTQSTPPQICSCSGPNAVAAPGADLKTLRCDCAPGDTSSAYRTFGYSSAASAVAAGVAALIAEELNKALRRPCTAEELKTEFIGRTKPMSANEYGTVRVVPLVHAFPNSPEGHH